MTSNVVILQLDSEGNWQIREQGTGQVLGEGHVTKPDGRKEACMALWDHWEDWVARAEEIMD